VNADCSERTATRLKAGVQIISLNYLQVLLPEIPELDTGRQESITGFGHL
jgi:hypothetical protein